jgi:hypothetical protein
MKVPIYRSRNIVSSQGLLPNSFVARVYIDKTMEFINNPLRLLSTNNAAVIPSRAVIRLLATAEDVTHS